MMAARISIARRSILQARAARNILFALGLVLVAVLTAAPVTAQAPSTYSSAYTGTDAKLIPPALAFGAANSTVTDPTFGSRILRATDRNTVSGRSLNPADAGFFRTWNANSTAIKPEDASGGGYWLEFNPSTFTVGTGSSAVAHPLPFDSRWMWSAVNAALIC